LLCVTGIPGRSADRGAIRRSTEQQPISRAVRRDGADRVAGLVALQIDEGAALQRNERVLSVISWREIGLPTFPVCASSGHSANLLPYPRDTTTMFAPSGREWGRPTTGRIPAAEVLVPPEDVADLVVPEEVAVGCPPGDAAVVGSVADAAARNAGVPATPPRCTSEITVISSAGTSTPPNATVDRRRARPPDEGRVGPAPEPFCRPGADSCARSGGRRSAGSSAGSPTSRANPEVLSGSASGCRSDGPSIVGRLPPAGPAGPGRRPSGNALRPVAASRTLRPDVPGYSVAEESPRETPWVEGLFPGPPLMAERAATASALPV